MLLDGVFAWAGAHPLLASAAVLAGPPLFLLLLALSIVGGRLFAAWWRWQLQKKHFSDLPVIKVDNFIPLMAFFHAGPRGDVLCACTSGRGVVLQKHSCMCTVQLYG